MGIRVVHYLNQFFGGLGGEDKAGMGIIVKEEAIGPGTLVNKALGEQGKVVATLICGDNFFTENLERAGSEVVERMSQYRPDVVLAGPAFGAGRYGIACGKVCQLAQEKLGVPAVTAMHPENPGAELYRRYIYIVPTEQTLINIGQVIDSMVGLGRKLRSGVGLGPAACEGYLPRGIRKNVFVQRTAAERAVSMILKKVKSLPFSTELQFFDFGTVSAADPIKDLPTAKIALVTSSGVVPRGDPDRIEKERATRWLKYFMGGLEDLTSASHEALHGGYDTRFVNDDPDRALPIDMMRQLEKGKVYGSLHEYYYVVSGMLASIANATKIGASIAEDLIKADVAGVILTST